MAQHGTISTGIREAEAELGYRVKLPFFEGPLDLLLFLIQKNQIDIYDIPIAQVTREFLEYLKFMRLLELEVGADFLVMAASLMSIKSQLLLPQPSYPEEFFQEDPRQELVNRLLEYRLFKAAAQTLEDKEEKSTLLYARSGEQNWVEKEEDQNLIEVSLYDLLVAFKEVVDRESEPGIHEIMLEEITVKERFEYIREVLLHRKRIPFIELIRSDPRKMVMVVTFLAILELIRSHLIAVKQQHPFGEIWVYRKITTGGEHHPFCEAR